MRTRNMLIAIPWALAMSACTTTQTVQSVEYMCASATALMRAAVAVNDQLTPADRVVVVRAAGRINPICSADEPPTLDAAAHQALSIALAELTTAIQ